MKNRTPNEHNSPDENVLDIVAIGAGPFNLTLACLADPIEDLSVTVLEARDDVAWHPGMLLAGATIQVPFLADLVTMADPTSRFSFLNYLKKTGGLYPFYVRENFYPLRSEYDAYCRWAARELNCVQFGRRVVAVSHNTTEDIYTVTARLADGGQETYRTRRLVLGTGTEPFMPEVTRGLAGPIIHSEFYLDNRDALRSAGDILVLGSGQSAAEIYLDLLDTIEDSDAHLTWATRSPRFFPMEYTPLTLELTSPEYSKYFHSLAPETRLKLLREQRSLYKGISSETVDAIHERLYVLRDRQPMNKTLPTTLLTGLELKKATFDAETGCYELHLHHAEQGTEAVLHPSAIVLATGYSPRNPDFLAPIEDRIRRDSRGRVLAGTTYAIDHADAEIFVQNAEEHTHGFVAPDLGMGAYRASVILNTITGREIYAVETRVAFQEFGVPQRLRPTSAGGPR